MKVDDRLVGVSLLERIDLLLQFGNEAGVFVFDIELCSFVVVALFSPTARGLERDDYIVVF